MTIGLTGGIGMGKSTVAGMFADLGVPVWDADAAVHRLYGPDGDAVAPVLDAFPGVASPDGGIDRPALGARVVGNRDALGALEAIVHPLVERDRLAFVEQSNAAGLLAVLCDIPLLLENGHGDTFDTIVVVTAPEDVRRARVMKRPGMTSATYDALVARQMPDHEKRAAADHLIFTNGDKSETRTQVAALVADLLPGLGRATDSPHE